MAASRVYRAPDGTPIAVAISPQYGGNSAANRPAAQTYADFLGSRVHGSELAKLRVYIGTPTEINRDCGSEFGVLACYAPAERRMFVPGEDVRSTGPFTRAYVVTHEYGHHIANFRDNYPFSAPAFGAKYWSSRWHICEGALRKHPIFFPGDEGRHYLANPGEGFADTYAHLPPEHYSSAPWQFSPRFRPDAAAYAAVRRDVLHPWEGQKSKTLTGSLDGAIHAEGFALPVSLDGVVMARVRAPRGAKYELEILNGDAVLSRGAHARVLACRRPSVDVAHLTVRVVRQSGSGPFTLKVRYPD
jgi:hypothetical protein